MFITSRGGLDPRVIITTFFKASLIRKNSEY